MHFPSARIPHPHYSDASTRYYDERGGSRPMPGAVEPPPAHRPPPTSYTPHALAAPTNLVRERASIQSNIYHYNYQFGKR